MLCYITFMCAALYGRAQEKRSDVDRICENARVAYEKANYKEALTLLNKCLEEQPGNADAYLTRGATREELKDLQGLIPITAYTMK